MRVLGAIRRSKHSDDDPALSPDVQRIAVQEAVAAAGGKVVGWAEDLNISASTVSPFKRPELGKWLAQPEKFDAVAWFRLDRAVRSMRDLHELARWATDHRKMLLFASGSGGANLTLDFRSGPLDPIQQVTLTMLAFASEMEAAAISERWKGTKSYLRSRGLYTGGATGWWLKPVPNPDGPGKVAVLDDTAAPVMRELIDRVIAGEPQRVICRDFNERGIPSPRGKQWDFGVTSRMLRRPSLIGYIEHNGEVVRHPDGTPVVGCEPLIDRETFDRLQAALDRAARPKTRGRHSDARLLTKLQFCIRCGEPRAYRAQRQRNGTVNVYSECQGRRKRRNNCTSVAVRADLLEQYVERAFLDLFGDREVYEARYFPAEDHTDDLKEAEAALDWLIRQSAGKSPAVQARYAAAIAEQEAKVERLSALPNRPERVERVPTGETYREVWHRSDTAGRRKLLLDGGFKIETAPGGDIEKAEALTKLKERYDRLAADPDCGELLGHSYSDAPFVLVVSYPPTVVF